MNLRSKMKERAKRLLLPLIFIPPLYSDEEMGFYTRHPYVPKRYLRGGGFPVVERGVLDG